MVEDDHQNHSNGRSSHDNHDQSYTMPAPPTAPQGWLSHVPVLQPSEFPRAPTSFLFDTSDSGRPASLATSPAYNLYLLNHHPAYALPGSADVESRGSASGPDGLDLTLEGGELFGGRNLPSLSKLEGRTNGEPYVQSWRSTTASTEHAHHPSQHYASSRQNHASTDPISAHLWEHSLDNQRLPPIPQDVQLADELFVGQPYVGTGPQQFGQLQPVNKISTKFQVLPTHHQLNFQQNQDDSDSDADDAELEDPPTADWPVLNRKRRLEEDNPGDNDNENPRPAKRLKKGERPRGRRPGEKRGPRTTVDPGESFMKVYNEAMDTFIEDSNIPKAQTLVLQAIGMNPEIFAAHSLLADIHFHRGDEDSAFDALMVGLHAHLNDVELWRQTADRIMKHPAEMYQKKVERAMYCYGAILRKDPKDLDARFQRAECARILSSWNRAFGDFKILLEYDPHNSSILAQFAKLCQDVGDLAKIKSVYDEHFEYYKTAGISEREHFTWQDVGVYIDLLVGTDETAQAIVMLKRLSRWLCGRQNEYFWEEYLEDDREFDQTHYPRRLEASSFKPNVYPEQDYGEALPLDLRGKLGVLRLKLNFREEAQSHFDWLEPDLEGEESLVEEYGDTFYEIAKALHDAKEHEKALDFYDALHRAELDLGLEFYLDMAASYYVCGKKEQAVEHYERALEIDPNSIEPRTQLAKLYRDLGDRQKAIKYGEEAVIMTQNAIPQTMNRKYERRDNRLAREAAERALKNAFRMPKGRGKAPGRVPEDLKYRTRYRRKFVKYVPKQYTEPPEQIPGGESALAPDLRTPSKSLTPPNDDSPLYERPVKVPRRKDRQPKAKPPPRRPIRQDNAVKHYEDVQQYYRTLMNHREGMRAGDESSIGVWIDCASAMIEDFRSCKPFYPGERHKKFEGYTQFNPRPRPPTPTAASELNETTGESPSFLTQPIPSRSPCREVSVNPISPSGVVDEYCGVRFSAWLDIFLELALLHANSTSAEGQSECYSVINAAIDCSIFYHHQPSLVQIHVCYLSCVLALGDDLTLYNTVLRWFMREFAFCTDTYRLYSAITMVNELPNVVGGRTKQMEQAIFKSGPNQKFIFRQLMSVDKSLPQDYNLNGPEGGVPSFMRKHREELRRLSKKHEKDPSVNQVEDGEPAAREADTVQPQKRLRLDDTTVAIKSYSPAEMDVVLFVLYAHVMMASGSFPNALSYLYRAYSLDPANTVCLLSMAFCYLHELFKRQTGNRHSYAVMGWAWFGRYEVERRKWAKKVDEGISAAIEQGEEDKEIRMLAVVEQEIQYNKARCWEMLGMADLGMRGYKKVLDLIPQTSKTAINQSHDGEEEEAKEEQWTLEAAYAMSTLYALNGNGARAKEITEKYLVV